MVSKASVKPHAYDEVVVHSQRLKRANIRLSNCYVFLGINV
jgi:hypothetical protein